MRCCVQNCTNDDLKKTNKSKGITFHKLPKDPGHCAEWLKILADAGCRLSKWLVVCSDHFKPEDFDETRPNQRRVKSGAVPRVMAPFNQDEFKVCRVCLALDVKMYDMKNLKFSEMFQNITGILACHKNEGILHHICWECAARLTAAAAFRDKALLSDALLKDLVHLNKSDIATLKENHTSLKSTLTFTFGIESVHYISENKKNEILLNDEAVKENKTKTRVAEAETEMEFQEEPWIVAPVKFEIESDPIAENDIYIQHIKHDPTFRQVAEGEIRNAADQTNSNKNKISAYKTTNLPIVNDHSHVTLVDDKEQKPNLDQVILTFEEESSTDGDTQSTADEKPVNKAKKRMNSKAGATTKRTRLTDRIKENIITLKKQGLAIRAISRETGLSVKCVDRWWSRYRKNGYTYRKCTTDDYDQSDAKQNYQFKPAEPGKEIGACSEIVRLRLHEAGLEHILMKKPERNAKPELIINQQKARHDDLKQRIIALKQEGITNSRIAYLLDTSRITVRKWWDRWCNEGHMQNLKGTGRKRKTTPEEDQLLIDRVMQEQTVHTPSLAMELGISPECLRRRLKGAGFKHMERKAYVPVKAGRSHKVDEELKQQIISMKLNGVSVTDIANQFRVPRTTIYQWCQRWCKDNNIKITSDSNISLHTSTEQEQSCTEGANIEKSLPAPAILSAQKSLWQKLPDVKYVP